MSLVIVWLCSPRQTHESLQVVVAAAGLVGKIVRLWERSSHGGLLGGLFLYVADDLVDDGMLCDDGYDLHLCAAFGAQEWVDLEDFSDQSCPGSAARFRCCCEFI